MFRPEPFFISNILKCWGVRRLQATYTAGRGRNLFFGNPVKLAGMAKDAVLRLRRRTRVSFRRIGPRPRAGFTLIELLVVVAIISILASIAVPNFLEAQVRAKVSRVKADMRTLMTGLEAYSIDHIRTPPRSDPPDHPPLVPGQKNFYYAHFAAQAVEMGALTTPMAYLTSLPVDVFARPTLGRPYLIDYFDPLHTVAFVQYYQGTSKAARYFPQRPDECRNYLLMSVGPDGFFGAVRFYGGLPSEPALTRGSMHYVYDPTNGTNSLGNIFRFREEQEPFSLLQRLK